MKEFNTENKRIWLLGALIILGSAFALIYYALMGNTNQIYNDIVVDTVAINSLNKSMEQNLLYIMIFLGVALWFAILIITKKMWNDRERAIDNCLISSDKFRSKVFLCAIAAMCVMYMLVYGEAKPVVVVSLVYAVILFIVDDTLMYVGMCTFFLNVYALAGLYRVYVFIGGNESISEELLIVMALVVSVIPFSFVGRKKIMIRLAMLDSLVIPATLLVFFADKYKYMDQIMVVRPTKSLRLVVGIVGLACVAEAVRVVIKKWKSDCGIDEVITVGSCIAIMNYNRYDGYGAIMPTDLHHPFENIIGFSQVFELGQSPFKEYLPVSGMYSIIHGAFTSIFGAKGTMANYYTASNLFFLVVVVMIVVLLRKQVDSPYVLLVSLVFLVQSYNRLMFMLPIMLLLMWPKLIEKKNTWLIAWFVTSLFQGLYYPLYGAATCIAFLPLGVMQIYEYVKSGELKSDIKTVKFWVMWGICAVLLVLCSYYLLGTLKHMLAMSAQGLLEGGVTRFGQAVPTWFFGYLSDSHPFIRMALYDLFSLMMPAVFVWIAFAIAIKVADVHFEGGKIRAAGIKNAVIVISAAIMPVICYTYTFIRMDEGQLLARNASVLYTGMVLVIIFALKYIASEKIKLLLITAMVMIPATVSAEGIFNLGNANKLGAYYGVPDGFVFVENDRIEKMGRGFIAQTLYDGIEAEYDRISGRDLEESYMADPAIFGYYYLFNIKGDGPMEVTTTVKSLSATQETVNIARQNHSVIGKAFYPIFNYYFYHWLISSGEYVWDEQTQLFTPNDGRYTREEIISQNKNISIAQEDENVWKVASSWGSSIDSLSDMFSQVNLETETETVGSACYIRSSKPFYGDDADFMYIDFEVPDSEYNYVMSEGGQEVVKEISRSANLLMRKDYNPGMTVNVKWLDERGESHTMYCAMSKGKLFIPLGIGAGWLLNNHDTIEVTVLKDGEAVELPVINSIRFYKSSEVE